MTGGGSAAGVALSDGGRTGLLRPGAGDPVAGAVCAAAGGGVPRGAAAAPAVRGTRPARRPGRGRRPRQRARGQRDAAGAGPADPARAGAARRRLLALPAVRGPRRGEPARHARAAQPVRLPPGLLPPGRPRAAGVGALGAARRPAAPGDAGADRGDRRAAAVPPGVPARHGSGRQLGAVDAGRARARGAVRQVGGRAAHPRRDGRLGRGGLARVGSRRARDARAGGGPGLSEPERRRPAQHLVPRAPVRRSDRGGRGTDVGE